ncbi:hypothetical protein ElyMa_006575300 [Elysia marginata]|uniref:Uncharacterized protein n=1 Tax=Elysia marginata TaxID=1093978 RepID=A0AAV4IBR6_9GAST|nr:hypothetical protein ElyMa_006575300 [Elysia marginata]
MDGESRCGDVHVPIMKAPWSREELSVCPGVSKAPGVTHRRSHGDLMRKDGDLDTSVQGYKIGRLKIGKIGKNQVMVADVKGEKSGRSVLRGYYWFLA